MNIETWNLDERFFIKRLIEFYYILASKIICKWIINVLKSVSDGGKMYDFF